MPKVEILKDFRDIHTGKMLKAGKVLDMPRARMAEVRLNLGHGYIREIPPTTASKPAREQPQEDTADGSEVPANQGP